MRTHSYRPLVVVATAILAAVARYAPVIDEPWDRSAGSTNGAIYFGRFEQNFERLGFAELRGAPLFYVLPMRDHPGSLLYWHHPPLIPWLIRGAVAIGGYSERTFRLVPIVCSTLTAVLLALLVGAARGTRAGVLAALLFAVVPMSWITGWQVGYEPIALAFMSLTAWLHLRLRTGSLPRYCWVLAPFVLAAWTDWIGLLIAPGIWLAEWLRPRAERRLGRALILLPAGAVSVAAVVAVMAAWQGISLADAVRALRGLGGQTTFATEASHGFWAWTENQLGFWLRLYGLPLILASLWAAPRFWRAARRGDALACFSWSLIVPAVANVVLFRGHSFDHEFWWAYAVPWAVAAAVEMLRLLRHGPRRWVTVGLLVLLTASSANEWRRNADPHCRAVGEDFNRLCRPDDGLVYAQTFDSAGFYVRAWYFDFAALGPVETFEELARALHAGKLRVPRVVAVVPDGVGDAFRDANLPRLRALGDLRRIDPAELRTVAPGLAQRHAGHALWVLTIG